MTKIWTGVIAASFVATVGLSAQGPPTSTPAAPGAAQQPAPSAQASGQSKSVTVSGCLQAAPASAATAGGGAAAANAPKFVLAAKPAAGAAGGGGAVGTSGTAMRYQLEGEEKTISPHLNHQVEITGTVQSSSASSTGAANAAPGSTAAGPTLKVESLKMVSATCS